MIRKKIIVRSYLDDAKSTELELTFQDNPRNLISTKVDVNGTTYTMTATKMLTLRQIVEQKDNILNLDINQLKDIFPNLKHWPIHQGVIAHFTTAADGRATSFVIDTARFINSSKSLVIEAGTIQKITITKKYKASYTEPSSSKSSHIENLRFYFPVAPFSILNSEMVLDDVMVSALHSRRLSSSLS